jgi:hypothetical protein
MATVFSWLTALGIYTPPEQYRDLYRAVSSAELSDIQATGQYNIPAGGVEGKYFALTLSDAQYFKNTQSWVPRLLYSHRLP